MKALTLFTLIILTNCSVLFAQSGYFGRKVMIEVGGLGRIPIVYNRLGSNGLEPAYYTSSGNSLKKSENKFDVGFLGGISLISKKTISFGLYGGMYYTENKGSTYFGSYEIDNQYVSVDKMESFKLRTVNIQPTLIISKERFTKPAGLSHEIGFGFQFSSLVPKDYVIRAQESNDQAIIDENKQVVYNKFAKYKAIGLTYTLKIKKPVSDRLFLTYGLRYNLTIGNFQDTDSRKVFSYNSNETFVKQSLNRQYLNLFVGLAFML